MYKEGYMKSCPFCPSVNILYVVMQSVVSLKKLVDHSGKNLMDGRQGENATVMMQNGWEFLIGK